MLNFNDFGKFLNFSFFDFFNFKFDSPHPRILKNTCVHYVKIHGM